MGRSLKKVWRPDTFWGRGWANPGGKLGSIYVQLAGKRGLQAYATGQV